MDCVLMKVLYVLYYDFLGNVESYSTSCTEDFCFFLDKLLNDDSVLIMKLGVITIDCDSIC